MLQYGQFAIPLPLPYSHGLWMALAYISTRSTLIPQAVVASSRTVCKRNEEKNSFRISKFLSYVSGSQISPKILGIISVSIGFKFCRLCVLLHKFLVCYLLLQFSTDFYKVWFSGILSPELLGTKKFGKIRNAG